MGSSFASWLFAIAANRTRTGWFRRTMEAAKAARVGAETAMNPGEDPEDLALRRLEGERVRLAVASLAADLRSTLELYYFAELSVGETAEALGVGEEAIKSRLFRGRKKLREILESRN